MEALCVLCENDSFFGSSYYAISCRWLQLWIYLFKSVRTIKTDPKVTNFATSNWALPWFFLRLLTFEFRTSCPLVCVFDGHQILRMVLFIPRCRCLLSLWYWSRMCWFLVRFWQRCPQIQKIIFLRYAGRDYLQHNRYLLVKKFFTIVGLFGKTVETNVFCLNKCWLCTLSANFLMILKFFHIA